MTIFLTPNAKMKIWDSNKSNIDGMKVYLLHKLLQFLSIDLVLLIYY